MSKKNKVLSKATWERLFAIKNYQDFLQEWLNLYDAFFQVNPPVDAQLQSNVLFTTINGLMNKWLYHIIENNLSMDDAIKLLDDYTRRVNAEI